MTISNSRQNKTKLVRIDNEVLKKLNDLGTNKYNLVFPSPNIVLRAMLGLTINERNLTYSRPTVKRAAGARPTTR
jgi:hypothetical protein